MTRAIALVAIGIAIGAAGMHYLTASRPAPAPVAVEGSTLLPAGAGDSLAVAVRRAVYDMAARADAATLETRLTDTAGSTPSSTRQFTLGVLLARYAEIDPARAVRFARRLGLQTAQWLPAYEAWAARDPSAALEELGSLDPADARAAGVAALRGLGGGDLRSVRRVMAALPGNVQQPFLYTAQIPQQAREQWITALAGSYAQFDAQGALAWIAQFRGEPAYDAAAGAVAQRLARLDPQAAASLVQNIEHPSNEAAGAAARVASELAQAGPRGAARWAFSLNDARTRRAAVGAVVQRWAAQDAESAQSWALSLPRGANRGAALGQLVGAVARSGTPDGNLLAAFSDDRQRQRAARAAAFVIAQHDAEEARAFADAQITDPALRRSAEQMIEQGVRNSFVYGASAGALGSFPVK
jgi:hypothetical protein